MAPQNGHGSFFTKNLDFGGSCMNLWSCKKTKKKDLVGQKKKTKHSPKNFKRTSTKSIKRLFDPQNCPNTGVNLTKKVEFLVKFHFTSSNIASLASK